ncbi:hypothetical protein ACUL41_16235 [Virgibacillus natechei]
MGFDEHDFEWERELQEQREWEQQIARKEKAIALQEVYFPLFQKCVDYYFEQEKAHSVKE